MKHPDEQLRLYCRLLLEAPVSVTAVRDPDRVYEVHVEDSLTALPVVREEGAGRIVDVGSGGGAPGIPLAIALGQPVTLLEATGTKAAFLERTAATLGVEAEVVNERSEVYARGPGRDAFDLAVARALAPPAVAVELCLPLVRTGGALVLWTTESDDRALTPAAMALAGAVERSIATGGARRLVLVRKLDATPERFPRRPGMAGKRPLRSLASEP
ncbi:MAG TPA: 16S rRNA (guanine(527)-N(7))-methyltransferase RsmG [Thermoleophilia bacterium]|nr:16S rRNA (guanine(527)-N(7))-methyltransferase RsmG [Thermoleophilia bacterium]